MRILVVDDDPPTLEMLTHHLHRWGHDVVPCPDGEAAWELFEEGTAPQMVVLDLTMPGLDGLELCRRIRRRTDGPYVYVLMLTARVKPEDLIAGFEAGADDYLTKPFHREEFEVRLRAGERIVDLQNELIEAREAIRVQAMLDPLTRLLNHGAIVDALSRELDRGRRDRRPLSVIMADLDEFKRINDLHGHVVGDRVLVEVAGRMLDSLRVYDSIGRYGGEEFLIVLPGSSPSDGTRLAERLRAAISDEPFPFGDSHLTVTISLGVTTFIEPRTIPVERLIQAADRALYQVKNSGRDRVAYVPFDGDADDGPSPARVAVP